jgi:hypothetical protein
MQWREGKIVQFFFVLQNTDLSQILDQRKSRKQFLFESIVCWNILRTIMTATDYCFSLSHIIIILLSIASVNLSKIDDIDSTTQFEFITPYVGRSGDIIVAPRSVTNALT